MAVDLHNRDDEKMVPLQLLTGEEHTLTLPLNKPINYQDWSYWSARSDFGSPLSSPIDSELGSSESSEELEEDDDYIAELTRKMALYMFQDDDNHEQENKSCSNQAEEVPVAVIEQFEKKKGSDDVPKDSDSEIFPSPSMSESVIEKNPDFEFQSKQALIDKQIQEMKQQWGSKFNVNKQKGTKGRDYGGFVNGQKTVPWPNSVQQTNYSRINSDMRPVFLDNQTGSRAGCSGTGVFLPRRIGNTRSDHSRRKTGCPTVLIPAKVVQALNLHFDKMGAPARPNGINFQAPESQHRQSQAVPTTSDQAMGLPQEWTY